MRDEEYVYLINLLNLRAKEYKKLCEKLDKLNKAKLDPNSEEYLKLERAFEKNQKQIAIIKEKIKNFKREN